MIKKILFQGRVGLGNCGVDCKEGDVLSYNELTDEVLLNDKVIKNGKRDFFILEEMYNKGCCSAPMIESIESVEAPAKKKRRKKKIVEEVEETQKIDEEVEEIEEIDELGND